jgi:dTDP-4-dehydrorhamnose 3,5-epimerase
VSDIDIKGVILRPLTLNGDERGWLAELFRADELPQGFDPAMAYVSMTLPGVTRGPHEHQGQTDLFCFMGPSMFRLYLWDNRTGSALFRKLCTCEFGHLNPMAVIVPPGVVHAYKNIGSEPGLVYNAPDRLYQGPGRTQPVDEIRWESDPQSPFRIED